MDGHNIVVFGQKGHGKTTWIRTYLDENPEPLYFICDHFKEYDAPYYYSSIKEFLQITKHDILELWKRKNVVFRGKIDFDEFFWLCTKVQNCVAVFDEIDLMGTYIQKNHPLYEIIHYGRHLNVGIISASRRPANVSRNLTSQADEIITFRIQEPRDLKYLEEFAGKDIADKAPNLGIGEFMRYPPREKSDTESEPESEE